MDTTKLDAPLRAAIRGYGDSCKGKFDIFLHTFAPPDRQSREASCLQAFGIDNVNGRRTVFSTSVSLEQIEALSENQWIKMLSLSQLRSPRE